MFITNLFQHVWNKIYFNTDLPKDRRDLCELGIGEVLFEFFVPTTKRKNSLKQWLGYASYEEFNKLNAKAVFLIIIDLLFYIPRLALNIIKLITEVLPLTLRELAYAVFESMVKGANETDGIAKGLYQLVAGVSWFFVSLLSLIYLIGGLVTSPGMTIISMMDTLEKLKCPSVLMVAILGFSCLAVFAFHLSMLVILSPIILPISVVMTPGALLIQSSGWIGGVVEFALIVFDLSGLMFNNNPNHPSLILEGKSKSLSILPKELLRIGDEKAYQKWLWKQKIKNFGDKATESQKAPYKTQAGDNAIEFLKICQINISFFSIEEQLDFFANHNLNNQFTDPKHQEILLFIDVVKKILDRLSKEHTKEKDNIDLAIKFIKLLPDWVLSFQNNGRESLFGLSDFISKYAHSEESKLTDLLNLTVCRINNAWLIGYVAEKIWFVLVDTFSPNKEKRQDLEKVKPFLLRLSDEDCELLIEYEDLKRIYRSVDNAILILQVLPSLFAYCSTKLIKCYSDNNQFQKFLKKNYQQLGIEGIINRLINLENIADLAALYPYASPEDKEKITHLFPDSDFSATYVNAHSYDGVFASNPALDRERQEVERNQRIERAEQYAREKINLYKLFNIDPRTSSGKLNTEINKFYRDNTTKFNSVTGKLALQQANEYKEILLCPYARVAYDNARNSFGFDIVKSFFK